MGLQKGQIRLNKFLTIRKSINVFLNDQMRKKNPSFSNKDEIQDCFIYIYTINYVCVCVCFLDSSSIMPALQQYGTSEGLILDMIFSWAQEWGFGRTYLLFML